MSEMPMTKAIAYAKERYAIDGKTRYLVPQCGGYAIQFDRPTQSHWFQVGGDKPGFNFNDRVLPIKE